MNLKNKKKKLLLILTLVLFLLPSRLVLAENDVATDSTAQQNQENENSTIDNIKKVIQEKKTQLGSVGANLQVERAYLAQVLRVSEETLTVNNYSGNKIIPLGEDILIEKNGKDFKVSEIAVGNWVSVYGEMINDNLKIKKVTVYEKDFSPKEKIITLGAIVSIGKNDLKVDPRAGEETLNFSFSKNTSFQNYKGEEVAPSNFYEDLQCLVVAFADNNGNFVVSTIRAISNFEK